MKQHLVRGLALATALVVGSTAAASAQWYSGGNRSVRVRGVVLSYSAYNLQIRARNGRYERVELHRGTVIDPRGTRLQIGMPVEVIGKFTGSGILQASEVDVSNGGNCNYGNSPGSYHGNGQYGTGYYNNGAYNNGACGGNWNRGNRSEDGGQRDRDDGQGSHYGYPNPYATQPPQGLPR